MKTFFLVCSFLLICSLPVVAQQDEAGIKATINQLYEAMRTGDSAMLVQTFADSAILQTISVLPNGKVRVKTEDVRAFGSSIRRAVKGSLDEKASFEAIHMDGVLASVWAPYEFFYNGKMVHCGANSFQMVRRDGVWKIQYLTDTRRKDCGK